MKKQDAFKIVEHIKPNTLEFNFLSFRELADNLRGALASGILKRNKRYKLILKEV